MYLLCPSGAEHNKAIFFKKKIRHGASMKGDRISADLAKSDVFATITFKACIVSYLCHYEAENYEFFC